MDTADKYTSLFFLDVFIYIFAFCLAQHLGNPLLLAIYVVCSIVLFLIFSAFIKNKDLPFSVFFGYLVDSKNGFLGLLPFLF